MNVLQNSDFILAIIAATLLFLLLVCFIIAFSFIYQKKRRGYLIEKEQLKHNFQQELLKTQLEIQEQTFKNISQEIHDNIGQVLTLAKLNINTMPHFESKELQDKIFDTGQLVTKAIQDLRDLSKSLNTDFVADQGLLKSIEYELNLLQKISGVETILVQQGSVCNLSHQKELILFRIFQEALNNIIKHSKASQLNVLIDFQAQKFLMQITDNGNGFDLIALKHNGDDKHGIGIRNMENRSRIIGANYTIVSKPGKGTTVTIELPIS